MTEQILTTTAERVTASVTVLSAFGEIDRDSKQVLADAAAPEAQGDGRRLVIDLTGVTFCDSAGLNLLFQLHSQLAGRGGSLSVAGAQDFVLRTLRVVNLDRLIPVHATVDDAVRAASAS
jgi:anti-anti-sigma factor